MAEVEQLLSEFIRAHRERGEADPRPYLERAEGPERRELMALIDGYLLRVPHRAWDPARFAGSRAEAIAADLEGMYLQHGEPAVALRGLRARADLKRGEVVRRLAERLGVADRQGRVAYYYHRMESGLLPAGGISGRVLEGLAAIIGSTPGEIRAALRATPEPPVAGPVMARATLADQEDLEASGAFTEAPEELEAEPVEGERGEELDEVDRLFLEGEDG